MKTKTQQQKTIERQHKSSICTFLKPIKNKKYFLQTTKHEIYRKNHKKHTGNIFPKKLVPISKNIIKEKSKCTICFIHEIEDKHGKKM